MEEFSINSVTLRRRADRCYEVFVILGLLETRAQRSHRAVESVCFVSSAAVSCSRG